MAGNMSKGIMSNCITDFQALKEFNIVSHAGPAPKIQEVIWSFPPNGWIKANTDGAARGSPGYASAGGIFRDSSGGIKGCFSLYLGIQSSLFAEAIAAMHAIEIAHQNHWHNFWLECDSKLVVDAFNNHHIIPWKLRNRWYNCIYFCSLMNFRISHIFREGNCCADKLANFSLTSREDHWWDKVLLAPGH
ncbi:unnamed protein product [Trifolium pratense]|uniref:Uncharacterized protein n=1 Tax=Trifolium pratense TaxID=57577 RepID=A0ACB0M307_TRIPR|nr:unnamed protein product [Trifolium pratense]